MKEYTVTAEDIKRGVHRTVIITKCDCCGHATKDYPLIPFGSMEQADLGRKVFKQGGKWRIESMNAFKNRLKND